MRILDWLESAAIKIPRSEARQILESVLGFSREEVVRSGCSDLSSDDLNKANLGLERRNQGEPLAYVVGSKEFYGRDFFVDNAVLIPRPETELLTEAALAIVRPGWTCVDVGTGSGCIAVTLALEREIRCLATDVSSAALRVAESNANRLNAAVSFLQADILGALQRNVANLVVSNLPYIANDDPRVETSVKNWEPPSALYAGRTGLEAIRRLIEQAAHVLRPDGWLALEFGMGQEDAVRDLLETWKVQIHRDLAGIERFVLAQAAG